MIFICKKKLSDKGHFFSAPRSHVPVKNYQSPLSNLMFDSQEVAPMTSPNPEKETEACKN